MQQTRTIAAAREPGGVRHVRFNRGKYGRHLLIDAAWVHNIPTFILDQPHSLDFYDIILVTRGRGSFWLEAHRHDVRPGTVLFTAPGQVRTWNVRGLDGICLFFTEGFIQEFLHDPAFLHRLPYFRADSAEAALRLGTAPARRVRSRLTAMQRELAHYRPDSIDLLRAQTHETLLVLAREYGDARGVPAQRPTHSVVSQFIELVERDFAKRHQVADYARELAVTPGHLSVLCNQFTGQRAKRIIDDALVTRAHRMLLYTNESSARIATALGFDDPSYFSRFFQRETGETPLEFRASARS
jgi:AraC family transcriptional activator of pobA